MVGAAHSPMEVAIGITGLKGILRLPDGARGIVIFAHGSGSGRHSPRNNHVAEGLWKAGMASLLCDLLSPEEELDRNNVFDIELLASRLSGTAEWVARNPDLWSLPIGYFGASTGAGAALLAASYEDDQAVTIVSRGGRPDLAGVPALARVRVPTLLIVGSRDHVVIELNRSAQRHMRTRTEFIIVLGAGHLFEEPGTLDEVIRHASDWFLGHFEEVWRARQPA